MIARYNNNRAKSNNWKNDEKTI